MTQKSRAISRLCRLWGTASLPLLMQKGRKLPPHSARRVREFPARQAGRGQRPGILRQLDRIRQRAIRAAGRFAFWRWFWSWLSASPQRGFWDTCLIGSLVPLFALLPYFRLKISLVMLRRITLPTE